MPRRCPAPPLRGGSAGRGSRTPCLAPRAGRSIRLMTRTNRIGGLASLALLAVISTLTLSVVVPAHLRASLHAVSDPPPAVAPPTSTTALLLQPPKGADRATWLNGVAAGVRSVKGADSIAVESAECAGLASAWAHIADIPTVDVPCPCADPAEGRSCYLVRWE